MTIHYQNAKGEETMLSGVIHLQNVDDESWVATTQSGKELHLMTSRIEGIFAENTSTRNITKLRKEAANNG